MGNLVKLVEVVLDYLGNSIGRIIVIVKIDIKFHALSFDID